MPEAQSMNSWSANNNKGAMYKCRDEIVRGIFHRENRILLRKSNISDKDTIFNLTVIC